MKVRIIILNDNVGGPGLLSEWGWSVYIEAPSSNVIFDANSSPRVIMYNSMRLGVDLSALNFGVLSHHHVDHYGGFRAVAEAKPGLKVYVPPGSAEWAHSIPIKVETVYEPLIPAQGFIVSKPLSSYGIHEIALGIDVSDKVIVLVGCSHPGADRLALNIAELTGKKVLAVIGGFHDPPIKVIDRLARIADYICPAHCSGETAKEYIAYKYPNKYCSVRTGTILEAEPGGVLTVVKY